MRQQSPPYLVLCLEACEANFTKISNSFCFSLGLMVYITTVMRKSDDQSWIRTSYCPVSRRTLIFMTLGRRGERKKFKHSNYTSFTAYVGHVKKRKFDLLGALDFTSLRERDILLHRSMLLQSEIHPLWARELGSDY